MSCRYPYETSYLLTGQSATQEEKGRHGRKLTCICCHGWKLTCYQYNADIPFEHAPAPGFYDVTEEQGKKFAAPIGSTLRAAEGKRRQEIEEQEEKNAKKRKGNDKAGPTQQFVAAREAQIKKLKEQEQVIRRRKLALPTPQVGERELEDIVKIGQAGETARELVGADADGATGRLLGEYEGLNRASMARTPRTAPTGEHMSFAVTMSAR